MIEQHFKKVNVRKTWVVHGYGGGNGCCIFHMVLRQDFESYLFACFIDFYSIIASHHL